MKLLNNNNEQCINVAKYTCFLDGVLRIVYDYFSCMQYRYAIPLPKTDKNGCVVLLYKLGIVAANSTLHATLYASWF